MDYELAIIGAGPAGFAASIYAVRAGIHTVLFDTSAGGGLATIAPNIENYPGFSSITGAELAEKMISPIINQQGQLYLVFALKGTPGHPEVRLIRPRLKQFSKVLLDLVKEKVSSQGQSLLDRLMEKVLKKK